MAAFPLAWRAHMRLVVRSRGCVPAALVGGGWGGKKDSLLSLSSFSFSVSCNAGTRKRTHARP